MQEKPCCSNCVNGCNKNDSSNSNTLYCEAKEQYVKNDGICQWYDRAKSVWKRKDRQMILTKPNVDIGEALDNPNRWIPIGDYCYRGSYLCPFWYCSIDRYIGDNGYCSYLNMSDADYVDRDYLSFLWDKVKECGTNYERT